MDIYQHKCFQKRLKYKLHKEKLFLKLKDLFELCDKEGKEFVTRTDLLRLTREISIEKDDIYHAFDVLDKDGNDYLNLDQFVEGFGLFIGTNQSFEDRKSNEDLADVRQIFDSIDKDRKGYIGVDDLVEVSNELQLTNENIQQIFYELSPRGDQLLTFNDFAEGLGKFSNIAKGKQEGASPQLQIPTQESPSSLAG